MGIWQFTIHRCQLAKYITTNKWWNIYNLINRNNGASIGNSKIKIYKKNRFNKWEFNNEKITGKSGRFKLKAWKNYESYLFEVHYGNDKKAYFSGRSPYIYAYKTYNDFQTAFIFTDRSIYRPGQTLYFKTIALKTTKKPFGCLTEDIQAKSQVIWC